MSIPEPAPELVARAESLSVRNVTVQVSAKRTVKVGDDFRSFESSMTVTFHDPKGEPISMDAAQLAAILQTPNLLTKVYTDLWIGGVMSKEETVQKMREAKELYPRLAGVKHDARTDSGDLPGTGGDEGPLGPFERERGDVPAGEVAGLSEASGPAPDADE
jgi:hypothetical protein